MIGYALFKFAKAKGDWGSPCRISTSEYARHSVDQGLQATRSARMAGITFTASLASRQ